MHLFNLKKIKSQNKYFKKLKSQNRKKIAKIAKNRKIAKSQNRKNIIPNHNSNSSKHGYIEKRKEE